MEQRNIRNFCIIAHIDHGKSTLADRMLELTGTVDSRTMHPQYLDQMALEQERGITIKMQPVRMLWHPPRINADQNADQRGLLYENLTYDIRGALFDVYNTLGPGQKESVYQRAVAEALLKRSLPFDQERAIAVEYAGKTVGSYRPDFVVAEKVLLEIKALPFLGQNEKKQAWNYLRGSSYRLLLLVNFGAAKLHIERIVYDEAREDRRIRENPRRNPRESALILNLIDTPGHVDFSYEVSRALAAVEGAILLVDAAKGIQAQTVAHCEIAQKQGLTIIPAVNKIDLPQARTREAAQELAALLSISEKDVFLISAKDGTGVPALLDAVVARIPQPQGAKDAPFRALIFDSHFDSFRGTIAHVRVVDGAIRAGDPLFLMAKRKNAEALALGYFIPQEEKSAGLSCGEIGWVATGVKEPDSVRVGETITSARTNADRTQTHAEIPRKSAPAPYHPPQRIGSGLSQRRSAIQPLAGYREPQPAVFASFFPEAEDDFEKLREAMVRLKLNDAALFFEPEQSQALGRGFRCGFLGMLHMDIVLERLRREFGSEVIATAPSVRFTILMSNGKEVAIHTPKELPDRGHIQAIKEPWVKLKILSPARYLSQVLSVLAATRAVVGETITLGQDRVALEAESPMLDIIEQFADRLKSSTQGFASFSWEYAEERAGDLVKLEVFVAHELHEVFSRIVPRATAEREARALVARLKEALPRQLFAVAIQAALDGKIVARETLPALRKDVTGYLYGGDFSRKKKLLQKQRRGKKRMEKTGRVRIPPDVFRQLLRSKH